MIPKTKKKLEKEYKRCENKFVEISNSLYKEYQNFAYEDLDSAKKEENPKWAIIKAYQSLFLMCNSILIKKLGFYSKDHNCVILALLFKNLISKEVLIKIHKMLKEKDKLFAELDLQESFFREISNIRIIRNKYMYLPKTLRKIKTPSKGVIEEVRKLIEILGELE
ncbi:MAG: hypothetical protein U9Q69_02410 [Nanoarchaeota archaeon]|nr:hypothetical protein [Nanoarchaeota archaeon]